MTRHKVLINTYEGHESGKMVSSTYYILNLKNYLNKIPRVYLFSGE